MSRSNPPRSSIVQRLRSQSTPNDVPHHDRPRSRRWAIRLAALFRWLHIYLSMFGLATVLFFGVTGLTLNHPDWFFANVETRSDVQGQMNAGLLNGPVEGVLPGDDPALHVDKLAVVEYLRAKHHLTGAVSEFRVDDVECLVSLKGPGYCGGRVY